MANDQGHLQGCTIIIIITINIIIPVTCMGQNSMPLKKW